MHAASFRALSSRLFLSISAPPTPQFALSAEAFKVAKTELGIHDYLMLASTTVLESLWAAFYATGEKRYVRRITELAQQWAAFSDDIPDHTDFWVNLEKKLPEALTVRLGSPVIGGPRLASPVAGDATLE